MTTDDANWGHSSVFMLTSFVLTSKTLAGLILDAYCMRYRQAIPIRFSLIFLAFLHSKIFLIYIPIRGRGGRLEGGHLRVALNLLRYAFSDHTVRMSCLSCFREGCPHVLFSWWFQAGFFSTLRLNNNILSL